MTQAPIQSIPTNDHAQWQAKVELFDYRQAANPVRAGLTEPIPLHQWEPALHQSGPTAVLALDLSSELGCSAPATSPGLAAHFLRIQAGEGLKAEANATSFLFYVLHGSGSLKRAGTPQLDWSTGDLFVLPAGESPLLNADTTSVLYWVHDGPLLSHLGVEASSARFEPTLYPAALLQQELDQLLADTSSSRSNRLSLLLANSDLPQSRTVTHTLWAMLGVVPAGAIQAPHRHQSVALDLIIDCDPGCYTLVGTELDASGAIANPRRIDWQSGGAFITPPGYWHSHYNCSDRMSRLLPIQDAGLHTYLRSLDMRFVGSLQGNI
ncbi:MAG: cupin [Cyanobacteria bacterium]|nr:cupin [Cyanobacteriota bacterium]MDA1246656.1 cupin [Cyanobacteriota bacterium]